MMLSVRSIVSVVPPTTARMRMRMRRRLRGCAGPGVSPVAATRMPRRTPSGTCGRAAEPLLRSPDIFPKNYKISLAELARYKCHLLALGRCPLQCCRAALFLLPAPLPPAFRPGKEILFARRKGRKTRVSVQVRLSNPPGTRAHGHTGAERVGAS